MGPLLTVAYCAFPRQKKEKQATPRRMEEREKGEGRKGGRKRACAGALLALTALAALCSAGMLVKHGWAGKSAMLEGDEHVGAADNGVPGRGRRAHAGPEQNSRGAYRCFVVHGKAKCVQARSNLLAKREIIEMGKEKVPTTIITPQRLDEIKAEISANKAAADRLLADEGWAGVEKSQQQMAARIADKVRSLSRMVGTLRASHDGIVQELIAKAAAPGPPVCNVICDVSLQVLRGTSCVSLNMHALILCRVDARYHADGHVLLGVCSLSRPSCLLRAQEALQATWVSRASPIFRDRR